MPTSSWDKGAERIVRLNLNGPPCLSILAGSLRRWWRVTLKAGVDHTGGNRAEHRCTSAGFPHAPRPPVPPATSGPTDAPSSRPRQGPREPAAGGKRTRQGDPPPPSGTFGTLAGGRRRSSQATLRRRRLKAVILTLPGGSLACKAPP